MREEKKLADALVRQDAATAPPPVDYDATRQAKATTDRDSRRMRVLTWLAVALWLIAVAAVILLLVMFCLFVVPKLKHEAQLGGQNVQALISYVIGMGAALIGVAVVILALAMLTTLLLVSASRRATLRHVNAGLARVSEQLTQLRTDLGTRGAG
jgi:hypothetical protein